MCWSSKKIVAISINQISEKIFIEHILCINHSVEI